MRIMNKESRGMKQFKGQLGYFDLVTRPIARMASSNKSMVAMSVPSATHALALALALALV